MSRDRTQAERIASLEAKLDNSNNTLIENNKMFIRIFDKMDEMEKSFTVKLQDIYTKQDQRLIDIENNHNMHVAKIAALQNKGIGAFAAASIIFTGIGGITAAFWSKLVHFLS